MKQRQASSLKIPIELNENRQELKCKNCGLPQLPLAASHYHGCLNCFSNQFITPSGLEVQV